jgi:cytochrome bd ubiquinol oxidase subunit I
VHWAFDTMVGIATLLILLALWYGIAYWRRRTVPRSRIFLWCAAGAGVLTYIAVESGWIVTEVGRQPWIVYGVLRTSDAVTHANGVWVSFSLVLVLYLVLAVGTVAVLRAMSRRWRHGARTADADAVYGPRPGVAVEPEGSHATASADSEVTR